MGSSTRNLSWLCWLIALGGCGSRVSVGDLGGSSTHLGDQGGGSDSGGGLPLPGPAPEPGVEGVAPCFSAPLKIQPICPAVPPMDGEPCDDAVENGICTWQTGGFTEHSYISAGCYTWENGKIWWRSPGRSDTLDPARSACPMTPPECGTSCSGFATLNCLYPNVYLDCGSGEGVDQVWQCMLPPPVEDPARAVSLTCLPKSIDESKLVKDLSELEANNWCAWSSEVLASGTESDLDGAALTQFPTAQFPLELSRWLCFPVRSVADCVKNLRSEPCTATLAQLDDCVGTLSLPHPDDVQTYWLRHGCGPLFANPTCTGVGVQPYLFDNGRHCVPQPG